MSESESLPKFSNRFIEENKKIKFTNSKKGGPYSKEQRDKRQNEVYRLHFEYGYSARKISEMMKIHRNTINGDIDYWYIRIFKKHTNIMNPEVAIVTNLQRLDVQRSRLREQLDKVKSVQEKMPIERMIYEIDGKILQTYLRLSDSQKRLWEHGRASVNQYLKDNHSTTRYLTLGERISVSSKTQEKISKLIEEDRKTPPHHI